MNEEGFRGLWRGINSMILGAGYGSPVVLLPTLSLFL
jgi:hypothetical protein